MSERRWKPRSPGSRVSPGAPRRGRLATAACLAGLALALAGCSKFDAALGKQWATVSFRPNTPVATMLKVRTACAHVANVRPQALPAKPSAANMVNSVIYRTDKASNANLAQLQQCVQRFRSVAGIDFTDSANSG